MTRIQDGTFVVPPSGGSPTDTISKQVDFTYNKRDQFATIQRYQNTGTATAPIMTAIAKSSFHYDAAGRLIDLNHTEGSSWPTLDRFQLS